MTATALALPALSAIERAAKPDTVHLAFPIYDHVPDGCFLFEMDDDMHAPHIRAGESAVVNLADREFVDGDLFLIRFGKKLEVMQVLRRELGIHFAPLNRPRSWEECQRWLRERRVMHTSDGPLKPEYLNTYLMGHVVGVYEGGAS